MASDHSPGSPSKFFTQWEKLKESCASAFTRAMTIESNNPKGRDFEKEEIESVHAFLKRTGEDTYIRSASEINGDGSAELAARRAGIMESVAHNLYETLLDKQNKTGEPSNVTEIRANNPPGTLTLVVKKPQTPKGPA